MRPLQIIILVAFGVLCFIAVIMSLSSSGPDAMYPQLFFALMTRMVGLFVSTVAALSLLITALGSIRTKQLATFSVALMGGLLMIEPHWSVGIALGAIVVTLLVREIFLPAEHSGAPGKPDNFTKE